MGKRILSLLSVIVLALAGIKAPVSAAAMKSPYVAEQAQGKAPNRSEEHTSELQSPS